MCMIRKAFLYFYLFFFTLLSGSALAEIRIADARGEQVLPQVPERIVVLNWDLLEQLLELGVTPVGAPNLPAYREWVVTPQAPAGITDIGTRAEPNLEKIAALKPDLILAASPQKDLVPVLETIAPVLYLPNFQASDQSAQVAIAHFRLLSQVVDKAALAEQKLSELNAHLMMQKQRLHQAFGDALPQVLAMRFANPTSVYLYTENSTTQYALRQLGLNTPLPQRDAVWGITQQRLTALASIDSAYVLYFLPFPQREQVEQSVLWRALPFVRAGKFNAVRPVWNYGGAMSIRYIADAVTDSLLEVTAQQ
ncbi:ABC transporter substrate-binding protein [Vibrio proteolyticus]|nr:iron-siderophore ABC transporter substrate-binding protein [Vibrio proteolyticus]